MHMVGRTIDQYALTAKFADDAAHVGEQSGLEFSVEEWGAVFGAENEVCQQVSEGVGHGFVSPLRGLVGFVFHPRLAPWAKFFRCSAASTGSASIFALILSSDKSNYWLPR